VGAAVCHPLNCPSAVPKHCHLTVGLLAAGEIVTQGGIVGCLPIYHQSTGDIVEIRVELLSEICLTFIPTLETLITIFNVRNAPHFIDQSINSIVTDCFTTTHILLIVCDKIILIVGINELQHVLQGVVLLLEFVDLAYSVSGKHVAVGSGESDGHWGSGVN